MYRGMCVSTNTTSKRKLKEETSLDIVVMAVRIFLHDSETWATTNQAGGRQETVARMVNPTSQNSKTLKSYLFVRSATDMLMPNLQTWLPTYMPLLTCKTGLACNYWQMPHGLQTAADMTLDLQISTGVWSRTYSQLLAREAGTTDSYWHVKPDQPTSMWGRAYRQLLACDTGLADSYYHVIWDLQTTTGVWRRTCRLLTCDAGLTGSYWRVTPDCRQLLACNIGPASSSAHLKSGLDAD